MVLDADEGVEPRLPEAVLDCVGPLPDVGEPGAVRRADGGLVGPWDAGDHNGAPLRQERAGAGVRCARSGARDRGFRRGAAPPSPDSSV